MIEKLLNYLVLDKMELVMFQMEELVVLELDLIGLGLVLGLDHLTKN